jgi:hypothetical protein
VPQGATVTASQWEANRTSISMTFSLGPVIRSNGSGCYTLYMAWQDSSGKQVLLTSYTIFVNA